MPDTTAAETVPVKDFAGEAAVAKFFGGAEAPAVVPTPADATAEGKVTPSDGSKAAPDTAAAPEVKPTSTPAPSVEQAPDDLSGYAEVLQSLLKSADPTTRALARKELDKGYMRRSDYTQKTQAVADVERDAKAWAEAMKNPRLVKAWQEALSAPATEAPDATSDEQEMEALSNAVITADGRALAAILKKRDERILAEAKVGMERVYEEKAIKPVQRFKSVEASLQTYIDETGIDREAMRAAVRKAAAYPGNGPIDTWDPAKAVDLVRPFLPERTAPTNTSTAASKVAPPIPKVAPPGRGSGAAAPAPQPAFMREGRPPKTGSEHAEWMAHLVSQQLGRDISVADLERAR